MNRSFDPDEARAAAAEVAYPDPIQREPLTLTVNPTRGRYAQRNNREPEPSLDWQEHAACVGRVDELFPTSVAGYHNAAAICSGCPVADACRAYANWYKPYDGVWAGQKWANGRVVTVRGRAEDPIERPRGRPRQPIHHGTDSGYRKHKRYPALYGDACPECLRAHRAVNAASEAAQRANRTTSTERVRDGVADWVGRDHPLHVIEGGAA